MREGIIFPTAPQHLVRTNSDSISRISPTSTGLGPGLSRAIGTIAAMDFVRHTDPSAFAARVTPFLMRDKARHNLLLGLITTLVERPDVYPEFFLWTVEDAGEPVAVALRTAPFNVVVSRPAIDDALEVLAAGLHEERAELPGVTAALPEVETFVTGGPSAPEPRLTGTWASGSTA